MTPLEKVFTLPLSACLDKETMVAISKAGHSRVPIVDGTKGNIIGEL